MKTYKKFLVLACLIGCQAMGLAQSEFPIGFLTFGFENGNDSLYTQIKQTNATWVQAWGQLGGIDQTNINLKAVQNVAGLKVLVQRTWNIGVPARSQRLRFDAEFESDNGILDPYFARNSQPVDTIAGGPVGSAWQVNGPGIPGYMAIDPIPDKEYYYGRNLYVATFVMQKSGGNSNDNVATLDVVDSTGTITFGSRLLKVSDFPASGYKAFDVWFNLSPTPTPLPKFNRLTGVPAPLYTGRVNVRVYWHGVVTTFLDFVTIQDSVTTPDPTKPDRWGAVQIFPRFGQLIGPNDATIYNDAAQFANATNYPLVQRFYLNDEPPRNGYLSFQYIDELILNNAGMQNISLGRGRSITAKAYDYLQRFIQDANPRELFVFGYWIDADIPSPSMTDAQADAAGVPRMSALDYNTTLQPKVEWATINILKEAITKANSASPARPFWFVAQAHGDICQNTGKYRGPAPDNKAFGRTPTGNELRMMVHLALAYGAKGIFYYPYGTNDAGEAFGCSKAWSVGVTDDTLDVTTNKPRHDRNIGFFSGVTGSRYTGYLEKWDAVQQINADLKILGPILLDLTWQSAFTSGEDAPGGSIVTTISPSSPNPYIEAATFSSDHIMLVNRKCLSTDVQTIEITTNKSGQWLMDDQLTHELFVSSNGVFKNITLNPGQGRLFKLRALTTNENWSGIINVANGITIANGSTLTIQLGSTLKFSSGASLTINGKLVADSNDPAKRITFAGTTATPGFWNGINVRSGSSANASTLRRCDVLYATDGVAINNNYATIDKCEIANNSDHGIYAADIGYLTPHPTISNNAISNNGGDGIYMTDGTKPTITGNRIENNGYAGIEAASNSSPPITYNFISGNLEYGVRLAYNSSPDLHRNTIKSNSIKGVYCFSNSSVIANGANTDTTKGRNEIDHNTGVGIYASNSSPNFGQDVTSQYGNNWIHDNTGYEAQQSGSGQLKAERCYWSNPGDISGNVDNSPTLDSAPYPVGWPYDDAYDPTLRINTSDDPIASLPMDDIQAAGRESSTMLQDQKVSNLTANGRVDLQAALEEGLKTGDWSAASLLIASLHRELQNARLPDVDFVLVDSYANDMRVASFIRKMLALLLVEKDRIDNQAPAALARLAAFVQNNPEHAAELVANAGLIHLYRQNDLTAAQNVLAQLQTMAQNGDATAPEHVQLFGRILQDYQRHRATTAAGLEKKVAAASQALTPTATALAQNYPNPFNPETVIRFNLNERQKVRLVIFDITGQRVRTLVERELSAGEQAISWDGRDQHGKLVATGVYFYELVAGNKVERRKMTLVR